MQYTIGLRFVFVYFVVSSLGRTRRSDLLRVSSLTEVISLSSDVMAVNFWKCLEKRSDGRLKFQRSSHHHSTSNVSTLSKSTKYQNSYRLESEKPFKIDPVDKIVQTVMLNRLEDASYDVNECPKLCSQVASEIRKKILKLDFKRYKIVVLVTIIEKASQSLETTMGFLWDVDRDNYSTYSFETQTFFAYCIVIGTYYE